MPLPPAQRAAVKAELTGGPRASSYAARLAANDCVGLAADLNGPSGAGAATLRLTRVTKGQFLAAIRPALLTLPTKDDATQRKWDRVLAVVRSADEGVPLDAATLALLGAAVADGLLAQGQADAVGVRPCSWAEAAFGEGASLTPIDVEESIR